MKNYFDEDITLNDVKFVCFILEKTSRQINQSNLYIIQKIGYEGVKYLLSFACMLHSQNFEQTCRDLIDKYYLTKGDITKPNKPTDLYMASVYSNLIWNVKKDDLVASLIDVYNSPICETIDDYKTSAHYEPLPTIINAYYDKTF